MTDSCCYTTETYTALEKYKKKKKTSHKNTIKQCQWNDDRSPPPLRYHGSGLVAKLCLTLVTPWTIACQAPLSLGFSRQDYWSRLPFLSESHTNAIFIPVQGTVLSMTVNLKMIVKWTEEYDLPKSNSFIFIGLIFIFLMKPLSLANEIIDSLIN